MAFPDPRTLAPHVDLPEGTKENEAPLGLVE